MDSRRKYQRITLVLMAGMIIFFGILTGVLRLRKGVLFEESLLRITEYEGRTVYSGTAYGEPVTIVAAKSPESPALTTVEFTIGAVVHDICQVEYPLDPISTEMGGQANGIRITKNGALLFEGGYIPDSQPNQLGLGWFDPDGKWAGADFSFRAISSTNPWQGYEISRGTALRFAVGPERAARGSWKGYGTMVLLTLLAMLLVRFDLELYLWKQSWYIQDPEPTDFYYLMEKIGWVLWLLLLLGGYCWMLTIFT